MPPITSSSWIKPLRQLSNLSQPNKFIISSLWVWVLSFSEVFMIKRLLTANLSISSYYLSLYCPICSYFCSCLFLLRLLSIYSQKHFINSVSLRNSLWFLWMKLLIALEAFIFISKLSSSLLMNILDSWGMNLCFSSRICLLNFYSVLPSVPNRSTAAYLSTWFLSYSMHSYNSFWNPSRLIRYSVESS